MMFSELEKVMASSNGSDNYLELLNRNITGKKSSSGVVKTARYLKRLYGFDIDYSPFAAFEYFWNRSDAEEKPLLTFIYAINQDSLLAESSEVVQKVVPGHKVPIESFEEQIEKFHSNRYSYNTRRSMAQNIASSWKQAGFIEGKVKNIRRQPKVNYRIACFAFLLAYLGGDRGDFIWKNAGVKSLCLSETELRNLAIEASQRDFMQYQYGGSVTMISFTNLLNKIGIDGNTN
ncbi:MAG: hypothetical protein H3C64_07095 [Candidatus Kuenenia stuttgartiensis]|nr:hypothetical protein [Candidatus Kuenenia stuttgartiensis]